jgi:NAD(P)-dependent dehydrogenase (short-subunit alcohol dehydrogenase family)
MSGAQQRFSERVVIVTGGASGIGEACVQRLAAEGGRVLLVDINEQGARDVADKVATAGGEVRVWVADICTEKGVAAMVAAAVEAFGRLDVVVNNAVAAEVGPLLNHTDAGWQRTFDSSVTAVWRSACHAVPIMIANGGGAFVNISSNAALVAIPGLGAYGAAKAGVIQITRQIAAEFGASGIRANSITPGVILSPAIAQAVEHVGRERVTRGIGTRPGTPDELSRVVAFLASDDAAYVNGTNIRVDGGWFAQRQAGGINFGMPEGAD